MSRNRRTLTPDWSVFRRPGETRGEIVVVPRAPLLIRLRKVIGEEYFGQAPLMPLKRFMDAIFIAGPSCIVVALYLPSGGGLLVWLGIICLAIASLYWFAPHFLCRLYLTRRGFEVAESVVAADFDTARAKGAP